MQYEIKQLRHNNVPFVPQTVAEAVLIHKGPLVFTLDKIIDKKVDTVTSTITSGLTVTRKGNDIDITHTNNIEPSLEQKPLQISYDNHGHIIDSSPLGKLTVNVNSQELLILDGSQDQYLQFGDDFKNEQNTITLRWNNYGDT